ncbi:hypothetical protein I7I50_07846 [Histoplasma capsulatum G186AR]|uniref:Uncharacterized protein n=1 Tax=Ajellomyces capsulatus TaxID=5037 RepID=A0A8H7YJV2_AJECA|nr:hypothetical protein I7I52_08362 [Histoplasma capsulatum]QSS68435.1 hypothetical protein I7I50_07846 [Histoplasma capsulatum G186AR]
MRTNGSHSLINTNKRKTTPFVAQQRMFMKTLRAENRCWTETRRRGNDNSVPFFPLNMSVCLQSSAHFDPDTLYVPPWRRAPSSLLDQHPDHVCVSQCHSCNHHRPLSLT